MAPRRFPPYSHGLRGLEVNHAPGSLEPFPAGDGASIPSPFRALSAFATLPLLVGIPSEQVPHSRSVARLDRRSSPARLEHLSCHVVSSTSGRFSSCSPPVSAQSNWSKLVAKVATRSSCDCASCRTGFVRPAIPIRIGSSWAGSPPGSIAGRRPVGLESSGPARARPRRRLHRRSGRRPVGSSIAGPEPVLPVRVPRRRRGSGTSAPLTEFVFGIPSQDIKPCPLPSDPAPVANSAAEAGATRTPTFGVTRGISSPWNCHANRGGRLLRSLRSDATRAGRSTSTGLRSSRETPPASGRWRTLAAAPPGLRSASAFRTTGSNLTGSPPSGSARVLGPSAAGRRGPRHRLPGGLLDVGGVGFNGTIGWWGDHRRGAGGRVRLVVVDRTGVPGSHPGRNPSGSRGRLRPALPDPVVRERPEASCPSRRPNSSETASRSRPETRSGVALPSADPCC